MAGLQLAPHGVLRHTGPVNALAWQPGGRRLLSGGDDGGLHAWSAEGDWAGAARGGDKQAQAAGSAYAVNDADVSADGAVALACSDGVLRLLPAAAAATAAGERRTAVTTGGAAVITARLSPDGLLVATGSEDGAVRLWDARGQPVAGGARLGGGAGGAPVYALRWSADGRTLAYASGRAVVVAQVPPAGLAVAGDGGAGAIASATSLTATTTTAAASRRGRPLSWTAHGGAVVTALDWCPVTGALATGGEDGAVRVWDAASGRPLWAPAPSRRRLGSPVTALAWAPSGGTLAAGCYGALWLFTAGGGVRAVWTGGGGGDDKSAAAAHTGSVTALAWAPDETRLAVGTARGGVLVSPVLGRTATDGTVTATITALEHVTVRWPVAVEDKQPVDAATWDLDAALREVDARDDGGEEADAPRPPSPASPPTMESEELVFREPVHVLALGHGHLVVTTQLQAHVFALTVAADGRRGCVEAATVELRRPARHAVLAHGCFAVVDGAAVPPEGGARDTGGGAGGGGGIHVFGYDGRHWCSVAGAPGLRAASLPPAHVALSEQALLVVAASPVGGGDAAASGTVVRAFDPRTGQPLGAPVPHGAAIRAVAVCQALPPTSTGTGGRFALLDDAGDVYLVPMPAIPPSAGQPRGGRAAAAAPPPAPVKVAIGADAIAYHDKCDVLLAVTCAASSTGGSSGSNTTDTGRLSLTVCPAAALAADVDLLPAAQATLPLPPALAQGLLPWPLTRVVSVGGAMPRLVVTDRDGAPLAALLPQLAAVPPLVASAQAGDWRAALRVARTTAWPPLWAALTALALGARQLPPAVEAAAALAAAGALPPSKLDYLASVAELPTDDLRASELALLRRAPAEAEALLLTARPAPHVYRAVKLNVRLGRWERALEVARAAGAHVDTALWYRQRHLQAAAAAAAAAAGGGGVSVPPRETIPAFLAAAAVVVDPAAIRARRRAEKAAERARPGAAAAATASGVGGDAWVLVGRRELVPDEEEEKVEPAAAAAGAAVLEPQHAALPMAQPQAPPPPPAHDWHHQPMPQPQRREVHPDEAAEADLEL